MPSVQGTRWCFTINNPTPQQEVDLAQYLGSDDITYGVYGKETGESGTPHFQGFLILTRTRTFRYVRTKIPGHIEKARGSSRQAATYCKKDNAFTEFGIFPGSQGSRTDLDTVLEWSDQFARDIGRAPTSPEVAQEHPSIYIRYPRVVRALFHRAERPQLRSGELREWQQLLDDTLSQDTDDRSILFYIDEDGGKGKTWFQQYYLSKEKSSQLLTIGKRDDLAHAIDETARVVMFNVPRGGNEYLQYTILEQLKDRMVFSPKYNSRLKLMVQTPHVVVFMNEHPDMTKMSADRYVITTLN
ncbi:MAG: putative viral replication protein [Tethyvirus abatis]|uniref:Viral replication protein n=1 Tax=Cressdnaviricota sp. TaxID=2748378 RepID=A0A345N2N8_9VIRU|nr:MAG: putative viral replication protein [Cressdnaviricota sp.]